MKIIYTYSSTKKKYLNENFNKKFYPYFKKFLIKIESPDCINISSKY